jgi:hypothetical protein
MGAQALSLMGEGVFVMGFVRRSVRRRAANPALCLQLKVLKKKFIQYVTEKGQMPPAAPCLPKTAAEVFAPFVLPLRGGLF